MATVSVRVEFQGKMQTEPQQRLIKETTLRQRSSVLAQVLDGMPANRDGSPKQVIVQGSFGPMSMLLDQIRQRGDSPSFKVHYLKLPIENVAMLWEATEILGIQPPQDDLRKHLRWSLSHDKLGPQQICTLHRIFYPSRESKLEGDKLSTWEVLVHHVAYGIFQKTYSDGEIQIMEHTITAAHPDLGEAIFNKIHDLKRCEDHKEDMERKKSAKKVKQHAEAHKKEQRERIEEELQGERTVSDGIVRQVLTRPPPVWQATVQEGKHGKRNRPGEGKRAKKAETEGEEGDEGAQ